MATKLVRLVNDKKKSLNNQQANVSTSSLKRFRDVDNEENLSELQERNAELELQNKRLNQNVKLILITRFIFSKFEFLLIKQILSEFM